MDKSRDYWNKNIELWGKFYLGISHQGEKMIGPGWLLFLYDKIILPIESRLMAKRYKITVDLIHKHIDPGMRVADVGCGTGIFTLEILNLGGTVVAIDNAQKSLELTHELIEKHLPERAGDVEYLMGDAMNMDIPKTDAALAMGLTPYINDIETFFDNILPTTNKLICLILNSGHWANRIRQLFPLINTRRMNWFQKSQVDNSYKRHKWRLLTRRNFASGYIDVAIRRTQK